jgi:hypothetical protein
MLNRTNRTLSAPLNRLYLGTRSLAPDSGANTGKQALRIRHAHLDGVVMRAGMTRYFEAPISGFTFEKPVMTCSLSGPPHPRVSGVVPALGQPGAVVPSVPPTLRPRPWQQGAAACRQPSRAQRQVTGSGLRSTPAGSTLGAAAAYAASRA